MFNSAFERLQSEFESWLKSNVKQVFSNIEEQFKTPETDGALELTHYFSVADKPLTQGCISVDYDSWRIEAYNNEREQRTNLFEENNGRLVRLFEINEPENQECLLVCRAQIKTADVKEEAELLLSFERQAEVLGVKGGSLTTSRAVTVSGTTGWKLYEVRYHFKKEKYPGLIKINIDFKSSGILWIKHLELLQAPVKVSNK